MRKLIVLIVVLATAWGGYWFVGSSTVQSGMTNWISIQQNNGLNIAYSTLKTRGFPNRFDTTIKDIQIADPRSGNVWSAPFFQILALSYKPNHIIAFWPNEQTIQIANERIDITSEQIKASVVFDPDTALTLNRSSFVLDDFDLNSEQGWSTQIGSGLFATRQMPNQENSHGVALTLNDVRPSAGVLAELDPSSTLPKTINTLSIDTVLEFDIPLDRFAFENQPPRVKTIKLNELKFIWGELNFRADGKVRVNRAGVLDGRINLSTKDWQRFLQLAVAAEVIKRNISQTVENALEILAQMSGDPNILETPLIFNNGQMSLGPIPLGPAPRLVSR